MLKLYKDESEFDYHIRGKNYNKWFIYRKISIEKWYFGIVIIKHIKYGRYKN